MADRLIAVFAETLDVPESELSDASSPDNTPSWDSHATMELVAAVEDAFEIELSTVEIMKMRSIGIARDVLRSKGVEEI